MRKILIIISLAAAVLTVSGCDFIKVIMGKPTSGMIAEMKERVKADEDLRSMIEALQSKPEEQAAVESTPEEPVVTASEELPHRYYIVIGIFSHHENATALAAKLQSKGYECVLLDWDNGMKAVTVNPTDHISEAYASLDKLSFESFCPQDVWIMNRHGKGI